MRQRVIGRLMCADDSYKAVVHSHSSKQANIQKLRTQLAQLEKDTASKLMAIDAANAESEVPCIYFSTAYEVVTVNNNS